MLHADLRPPGPQPGEPAPPALISLLAGGLYAVPPRGGAFPGGDLFAE